MPCEAQVGAVPAARSVTSLRPTYGPVSLQGGKPFCCKRIGAPCCATAAALCLWFHRLSMSAFVYSAADVQLAQTPKNGAGVCVRDCAQDCDCSAATTPLFCTLLLCMGIGWSCWCCPCLGTHKAAELNKHQRVFSTYAFREKPGRQAACEANQAYGSSNATQSSGLWRPVDMFCTH